MKNTTSSTLFRTAALLFAMTAINAYAAPTRLVVAFPPGGPADTLARLLAKQMESELKESVIVENKPGANGGIAATHVIKSPADGSVLFLSSAGAVAINPSLYTNLPYSPQTDFAPISLVVHTPEILVVPPDNRAATAADFVKAARQGKSQVSIASTGVGSMPHMAITLLKSSTRVDFLHVAYKGAAPAITDTIGGHVGAFFGDVSGLMNFIKEKRLKAIGVAAPARLRALPDVPTMAELGISNVEASNWYGLFAPANTPPDTVAKLNLVVRHAIAAPEFRNSLYALGVEPSATSPAEFTALVKSEADKWARVVKEAGIKGE